tara:strand:+ start:203 stop:358 length:156 start_codon:yes stop_codon:yes gene_type:complete
LIRVFKLLIGVGGTEDNFLPSPFKILITSIILGFLFLSVVTILLIITEKLL